MPPGKGPKAVTFTDGRSFNVPDDTVITYYVCPSLPLTLLSFSATLESQTVVALNWETASEVNINRFELERSMDGVQWIKIHEKSSKGSMNEAAAYYYTDNHASKGINYYRLRIVENDNTLSYSKIQVVNISIQTGQVSIYPNPTEHLLTVELTSIDQEIAYLKLLDVLGRTIMTPPCVQLYPGVNTLLFDLSNLTSGTYIMQVITKSGALVGDYRVVKK